MKRRLFNLAAAVSLGMMIAVIALWVRSHWRDDTLLWQDNFRESLRKSWISSTDGFFIVAQSRISVGSSAPSHEWHYTSNPVNRIDDAWIAAFQYMGIRNFRVPHWLVAAGLAVFPLSWLVGHHRRRRRASLGLCPMCGYDLRATPARCPECGSAVGTPVAPKPAEAAA